MTKSTNEFVLCLVGNVSTLRHIYDKHIEEYDELLPHVFFGDLTRYVVNLYKTTQDHSSDMRNWDELDNIIIYLENGISKSDENVRELIAVSFLENLESTDSSLRNLEQRFGPNLKKELKVIRGA